MRPRAGPPALVARFYFNGNCHKVERQSIGFAGNSIQYSVRKLAMRSAAAVEADGAGAAWTSMPFQNREQS
jgi:hypothetical protein